MGLILESTLLEAVSALVGICTLIYYFFNSRFNYWKNKGVTFLTPTIPFGNFRNRTLLRTSQGEAYKAVYEQANGLPFIGVYQMWNPQLFVKDPELIKHILVKDFTHFHDRGVSLGDPKLDPLGQHLFGLEGTKWRNLRMKLTPTFTSGKMKLMYNVILECAQELEKALNNTANKGESLELREMTGNFTTDVIGSCVFGLQFNSLKDPKSEFREMGRKMFATSKWSAVKWMVRTLTPSLFKLLRLKTRDEQAETFFIKAIADTMRYREENGITRKDFLQLLIQLKNKGKVHDDDTDEVTDLKHTASKEDDVELDDILLTAQAFVFFIAGFETSSTTMSFCLYELAKNPEIQTKVQQEIDTALHQSGSFTYECIQGMAYLGKVVDETLRKHVPLPFLVRKVTKPYTIPNTSVHLEEGTKVFIPTIGLHHDPRYYPDPERFDPERFSEESKAKRPNYTYLPFGDGPRNCIGLRFGLLQTKVGLAVLLSKFKFGICERTQLKLKLDPTKVIPTPIDGIWLKISLRNDK